MLKIDKFWAGAFFLLSLVNFGNWIFEKSWYNIALATADFLIVILYIRIIKLTESNGGNES